MKWPSLPAKVPVFGRGAGKSRPDDLEQAVRGHVETYSIASVQPGGRAPQQEQKDVQVQRAVGVAHQLLDFGQGPGSVLLDDPVGTGKTVVALAAAAALLDTNAMDHVLVVAPSVAVKEIWGKRAARLRSGIAVDGTGRHRWRKGKVVITTAYDLQHWKQPPRRERTLVVVDEAHRGLANPEATINDRLKHVALGCRLLLVTATPVNIQASGLAIMLTLPGAANGTEPKLGDVLRNYAQLLVRGIKAERAENTPKSGKRARQLRLEANQQWADFVRPALRPYLLSPYPYREMGVPRSVMPAHCLVPLGSWGRAYHLARIVPELAPNHHGMDVFSRQVCSSSEAVTASAAFTALAKDSRRLGGDAEAFLELLKTEIGTGSGHPKVAATVQWVKAAVAGKRHVLVFCSFLATQKALHDALAAEIGATNVAAPTNAAQASKHGERFLREVDDTTKPFVLVVTDKLSESIDLDGGFPRVVHHDLVWSPVRLEQRHGRVVRMSTGFRPLAPADIFVPVLDVPEDRRLYDVARGRSKLARHLLFLAPEDPVD